MREIVVAARFNGPPDSGNGGYTCGLVAAASGVAAPEVTLRRPPPLDVPLRVDGGAVYDGEHLVATVAPAGPVPDEPVAGVGAGPVAGPVGGTVAGKVAGTVAEPPAFPGYDAARAAEARYAGLRDHPFPTCVVCGPARDDGLGLRPGPVGDGLVATTWTPGGTTGEVPGELVWASLDCPGAWALVQTDEAPIVLGRLAVEITGRVHAGQPHVVVGWRAAPREGRKHFAGTALYDAAGTLLARGRATWVALQPSSGAS